MRQGSKGELSSTAGKLTFYSTRGKEEKDDPGSSTRKACLVGPSSFCICMSLGQNNKRIPLTKV